MYVQINIGRNIDNVPMGYAQWLEFQNNATLALFQSAKSAPYSIFKTTVESHNGMGRWFDSELNDYVIEESVKISFFDPAGFDLDALKRDLVDLKIGFKQDAIALIVGSELI